MAESDVSEGTRPRVVIVGGAPATGKTTLASPLAQALQLPLLSKDLIKESLLDSFGATDLVASQNPVLRDHPWTTGCGAETTWTERREFVNPLPAVDLRATASVRDGKIASIIYMAAH